MIPIPIPVFSKRYTTTVQGGRLKFVPCEHCSVEYVYVIERDATGVGTSLYMLNNEGAAGQATSNAREMLSAVLENDFDPVPCPVCGHYQRYMFPKLLGNTGLGVRLVLLAVVVIGAFAAVNAVFRTVSYVQNPTGDGLGQLVTAWSLLPLLGVAAFGLSIVNKALIGRFDPNATDPEARLAIGRSRAVTREEFEKAQEVLIGRFDPNASGPEARIAIDRSRGVTREEPEKAQPTTVQAEARPAVKGVEPGAAATGHAPDARLP